MIWLFLANTDAIDSKKLESSSSFVGSEACRETHLAGAFTVKHAIGNVALVAKPPLTVVHGDMNGIVVANVAGDAASQGDLRVTRGDGPTEFDLQLGGDASGLQAPREYPVGQFVDKCADDAAVQGLDPAVVVDVR